MIGVAIDENLEKLRELTADVDFPILVDADHVLTELYAISNVPTVVLINEDDSIAMPNWSAYGSNLFSEFTGVEADRQHDRIRRWVRDGDAGMSTSEAIGVVAISPARKKPPVSTSASHLRCAIGAIKRAATETSTGPRLPLRTGPSGGR